MTNILASTCAGEGTPMTILTIAHIVIVVADITSTITINLPHNQQHARAQHKRISRNQWKRHHSQHTGQETKKIGPHGPHQ